ncbi:MAG: PRC-barrel domain-containing protein [Cyclobacteriaceae bacterium]
MSTTSNTHSDNNALQSLNNLKQYHVAEDSHDIRGWTVVGRKNDEIGKVDDLIVDTDHGKARYVTVVTDKKLYANETERKILVPVGRTKVENDRKALMIDSLDREKVRFYPVYTGETITRDYEYGLKHALQDDEDTRRVYENQHKHNSNYEDTRRTHKDGLESEDPLVRAQAERDVAKAERDIYKSRYETLQHQLRSIRDGHDGNTDNHNESRSDDLYRGDDYNDTYFQNRYHAD